MDLDDLTRVLAATESSAGGAVEIADLAYDARRVSPGAVFFCVPGSRADGHDFAGEAVAAGAIALVVERPLELDVPQLLVDDARASMAIAADAFFGEPTRSLEVAGVTGTNGKTTSTFLLRSVLDAAGRSAGLVGTVEWVVGGAVRPAPHTTPEAIDLQRLFREMLDAGDRSVAVEASSHGSTLHRLDRVRFDALVFTNLSQDHLDLHGTMEDYYQAKRRLFTGAQPPPAAVNVADEHGRRLAIELAETGRAPLVTFGLTDAAEIRAEGLEVGPSGSRFTAAGIEIETPLRGRFNVENVLGVIAAGILLDIDDDDMASGVRAMTGVPGRFEAIDEGQPYAVIVDYAHTPDSLDTALQAARELGDGARDLRLRRRRRPRPGQAADHGRGGGAAGGSRHRHLRQPAQRGSARDHPGHPPGRGDRRRDRSRPALRDPSCRLPRRAGRRGRDRRQGPRAGPGHGWRRGAVRRSGGGARGVARGGVRRVIPVAWEEIEALDLGVLVRGIDDGMITGVSADSRTVGHGDLFVALNSGVDFVGDAAADGAATLVPRDQHAALAALASLVRGKSDARVVAVVGSTGKTSTKDALAWLCNEVTPTVAAAASQNNEIGLPLTVLRLEPDTDVLVTEMGMRGLGQIAELCEIARPELTLVSSIGPEHLELVGTVENVARANAEAIDALPEGGIAVVPADASELEPFLGRTDIEIRRFDRRAVERVGDSTRWRFHVGGQDVELALPFDQRHHAENVLAALTAYDALGLPLDRAHAGAARIALSAWRGEIYDLAGGGLVINDAYNANPTSMRAALLDLDERAAGRRRVAILGEMAELGEESPRYHEEIGALLAELGIEVVIAVGVPARGYVGPASENHWISDAGAFDAVGRVLQPGDAILVKASRAVGLEGIPASIEKRARAWSES